MTATPIKYVGTEPRTLPWEGGRLVLPGQVVELLTPLLDSPKLLMFAIMVLVLMWRPQGVYPVANR